MRHTVQPLFPAGNHRGSASSARARAGGLVPGHGVGRPPV